MPSSVSFSQWAHFVVAEGSAMVGAAAEERGGRRRLEMEAALRGRAGTCWILWELSLHVS